MIRPHQNELPLNAFAFEIYVGVRRFSQRKSPGDAGLKLSLSANADEPGEVVGTGLGEHEVQVDGPFNILFSQLDELKGFQHGVITDI